MKKLRRACLVFPLARRSFRRGAVASGAVFAIAACSAASSQPSGPGEPIGSSGGQGDQADATAMQEPETGTDASSAGSSGSSSNAGSGSSGAASGAGPTAGSGAQSGAISGAASGSVAASGSAAGSGSASSGMVVMSCPDGGVATACGSNPTTQSFQAGLTHYDQTAANNCAMPWPSDGMYAALSTNLYDAPSGSASCGKCVEVNGKTLLVVDQCPASSNQAQCSTNHLDLSPTAYQAVQGSLNPGSVANSPGVSVKYVPCPVTGNIKYSFTSSTQKYYMALIILNAKYGIQKVEYRAHGDCVWTAMAGRTDADAHFIINGATVPNPIDFRVTDEWGQVIEDDDVQWSAGQAATGGSQFPTCQ
jgi:expansin (peptidoglycan-binding protein)